MSERDAIASVLRLKAELEALQQQLDACKEKDERIAELKQENARLREALGDAIDSYEEYAQYAGDYLMKKHRVDEDIAELRKVLESSDDKHSP